MGIWGDAVTIGSRLAKIAERLPGKSAITEGNASLTYGELDAAATAIAGRVATAAAGRPGFVCLLFQSKTEAIKAMLGAGRCGRAYVCLDAGDPDERLRFILEDSAPIAVLTERSLLERARILAHAACDVLDIGALDAVGGVAPIASPAPDATAYVVYTSGSTGVPKGVCQTQRNLLFFAEAYARALDITEADRLSLVFSLSFGASNMNIFAGLMSGGTLCAYDMRHDGIPGLADWLDRERVSVLHTVPTVFRELTGNLAPERRLQHLRAIDLAGEALFDSDVDLFNRHTLQGSILVNQLGATEASVIAQYRAPREGSRPSSGILPVGRCPKGLRVLIRREDGSEAAPNEVGEIVVRSAHVSPGYWRRHELDAASFASDPSEAGARRYFTRDLGRIDEVGNLHFLGRKGSRVKIRGHSVDLNEVEAALCACPGVAKAAVLAAGDDPQKEAERLVAYVVTAQDAERNALRLRRRLARGLPSYMLPSAFVFMDALPLTSSGKIDRKALAAVKADGPREIEGPRDDVERRIVAIFQELLEQPSVGRCDDFFLLGGDSLSVVELQTRLRDAFGVGVGDLYHDATVAGIAAGVRASRLRGGQGPRSMPILVPLREKGGKPPLFLIHGRLGQAFVSPQFLRLLGDDQPVWAFQARGLDGLHEPHATIEAAAVRSARPPVRDGRRARNRASAAQPHTVEAGDGPHRGSDRRSEYAKASVRTALAFEHAIRTHQPQPYDGPVLMIGSRARMQKSMRPASSGSLTATWSGSK